ncbi:hypothetical protein EVAR_15766_1 [Eumeta japonica]|uniref:Uncharacterized protein n=1 Tax=Eumeta variegata TaxID=151549 RepID=A0A4C1TZR3_EUMVA|nr:hypothetical protein EVAR_15766_1 [Eumeta japonica]
MTPTSPPSPHSSFTPKLPLHQIYCSYALVTPDDLDAEERYGTIEWKTCCTSSLINAGKARRLANDGCRAVIYKGKGSRQNATALPVTWALIPSPPPPSFLAPSPLESHTNENSVATISRETVAARSLSLYSVTLGNSRRPRPPASLTAAAPRWPAGPRVNTANT